MTMEDHEKNAAILSTVQAAIDAAINAANSINYSDLELYWSMGMAEGDALAVLRFTAFQALWNARVASDEHATINR